MSEFKPKTELEEIETISIKESPKKIKHPNTNEINQQGFMKNNKEEDEDSDEEDNDEEDEEDSDEENDSNGIPGLFGGMDLSDCLNTFLTNQNEENIADILTGFKKSLDTQNKILMKILGAIQNMS